jgi:hypothetical protein
VPNTQSKELASIILTIPDSVVNAARRSVWFLRAAVLPQRWLQHRPGGRNVRPPG